MFYLPFERYDKGGELANVKPIKIQPKSSWSFKNLKENVVQKLGINEQGRTIVFANVKNGRIERLWQDNDSVTEIEGRD